MTSRHTFRCALVLFATFIAAPLAIAADEASIKARVLDPLGGIVPGASVQLIRNGREVAAGTSDERGEYVFARQPEGRYQVTATMAGFEPATTDPQYVTSSGQLVVPVMLTIGALQQAVVVSAAAAELPQARVGAPVTVIDADMLSRLQKTDVLEALRTVPGVNVVQTGARGGTTSLFVRGGNANFNKVLIDGVPANDIGGTFDFGDLATTGVERVEVLRGSNSVLYGTDAMTGVVSVVTRRGRTVRPELTYSLDGGNLATLRHDVSLGGVLKRFDYFSNFTRLSTDNNLPNNRFENAVYAGRFGVALGHASDLSVTIRRKDSDYQSPNAFSFYGIPDDSSQTSKSTTASAVLQSALTDRLRTTARVAMTDQHYHYRNASPTGQPFDPFGIGPNYLGNVVTIRGANGTSATGQAILDYGGVYPVLYNSRTERQLVSGQADYHVGTALDVSAGARFEHEEGGAGVTVVPALTHRNGGAFVEGRVALERVYLNGGVGIEHHAVFGAAATPRLSAAVYLQDPASGHRNVTKVTFNVGRGIKGPSVSQQRSSLFTLAGDLANSLDVAPIGAERSRSVDVGVEQTLWGGHAHVRASFFNNRFSDLIEFVSKNALPQVGVPAAVAAATAFGAYVNSASYTARGVETSAEVKVGSQFHATGSYTYLDAVVLDSFSSSALQPVFNPAYPDVQIGLYSPLVGARPFRRPTHTGNITATYVTGRAHATVTAYAVGKADDSTFLSDRFFGNTMALPNHNLAAGYQKVDLGASYLVHTRVRWYASVENLLNEQYHAASGFPALPRVFRSGVAVTLGGD